MQHYRGVNIKNPPLKVFCGQNFQALFYFSQNLAKFQALFYYSQNLTKHLGPIYTVFGPFFERFPLSNAQKAQIFRALRFFFCCALLFFTEFLQMFWALFYFSQNFSKNFRALF